MDKEHKVSVYDMVKELNLKEVTPEINSREVYIEQAEINRPALQLSGRIVCRSLEKQSIYLLKK